MDEFVSCEPGDQEHGGEAFQVASVYPELVVGGVVDPLLQIEVDMQRFFSLCTSVMTQHCRIYDIIYNI